MPNWPSSVKEQKLIYYTSRSSFRRNSWAKLTFFCTVSFMLGQLLDQASKGQKLIYYLKGKVQHGQLGQIDLLPYCLLYSWPTSRSSFKRAEIYLLYLKIKLQKSQLGQIDLLRYCLCLVNF